MVKVPIDDKQQENSGKPAHGPWGGKGANLLSNPQATAVFPPTEKVKPVPEQDRK